MSGKPPDKPGKPNNLSIPNPQQGTKRGREVTPTTNIPPTNFTPNTPRRSSRAPAGRGSANVPSTPAARITTNQNQPPSPSPAVSVRGRSRGTPSRPPTPRVAADQQLSTQHLASAQSQLQALHINPLTNISSWLEKLLGGRTVPVHVFVPRMQALIDALIYESGRVDSVFVAVEAALMAHPLYHRALTYGDKEQRDRVAGGMKQLNDLTSKYRTSASRAIKAAELTRHEVGGDFFDLYLKEIDPTAARWQAVRDAVNWCRNSHEWYTQRGLNAPLRFHEAWRMAVFQAIKRLLSNRVGVGKTPGVTQGDIAAAIEEQKQKRDLLSQDPRYQWPNWPEQAPFGRREDRDTIKFDEHGIGWFTKTDNPKLLKRASTQKPIFPKDIASTPPKRGPKSKKPVPKPLTKPAKPPIKITLKVGQNPADQKAAAAVEKIEDDLESVARRTSSPRSSLGLHAGYLAAEGEQVPSIGEWGTATGTKSTENKKQQLSDESFKRLQSGTKGTPVKMGQSRLTKIEYRRLFEDYGDSKNPMPLGLIGTASPHPRNWIRPDELGKMSTLESEIMHYYAGAYDFLTHRQRDKSLDISDFRRLANATPTEINEAMMNLRKAMSSKPNGEQEPTERYAWMIGIQQFIMGGRLASMAAFPSWANETTAAITELNQSFSAMPRNGTIPLTHDVAITPYELRPDIWYPWSTNWLMDNPPGWLTDSVVFGMLRYYARDVPDLYVIDPVLWEQWRNVMIHPVQGENNVVRPPAIPSWARQILIPFNPGGDHWTLGYIDMERGHVVEIDSLNTGTHESIRTDLLYHLLDYNGHDVGRFQTPSGFAFNYNSPEQENIVDCGLWVITHGRNLAERGRTHPQMRSGDLRNRVVQDLYWAIMNYNPADRYRSRQETFDGRSIFHHAEYEDAARRVRRLGFPNPERLWTRPTSVSQSDLDALYRQVGGLRETLRFYAQDPSAPVPEGRQRSARLPPLSIREQSARNSAQFEAQKQQSPIPLDEDESMNDSLVASDSESLQYTDEDSLLEMEEPSDADEPPYLTRLEKLEEEHKKQLKKEEAAQKRKEKKQQEQQKKEKK